MQSDLIKEREALRTSKAQLSLQIGGGDDVVRALEEQVYLIRCVLKVVLQKSTALSNPSTHP